jgi:mannose-1-phosphate guanylyltransferase
MRAMILAAGLGTRLHPLTLIRPKVLMPLRGINVLDFWLERLRMFGFSSVTLNAYHLKEDLVSAVTQVKRPIPVEVLGEHILLGTGGGIRTALSSFGDEPFAVINGDIICDAPLDDLYRQHVLSGAEVSMLLHDWPEFNNVGIDENGSILGFGKEVLAGGNIGNGFRLRAFTGIHFINPSVLRDWPAGVPLEILDIYRGLIARGMAPKALFCPGLFWREMGSIESYKRLTAELGALEPNFLPPLRTGEETFIHPEAFVAPGTRLKGSIVAGRGVRIGKGARLEDVILWDDVRVEAGSSLTGCIVADGMRVSGNHSGKVFVPVRE